MAKRKHTSISILSEEADNPLALLASGLNTLGVYAASATKNKFRLGTHSFYGPKTQDSLTEIRRRFLDLKSKYSKEKHPQVAAQLEELAAPLNGIQQALNMDGKVLKESLRDILHKVNTDLASAIQQTIPIDDGRPFITPDILRPGVYRKILEEANQSFNNNCPNACAAMLRRLVESLIIEAFDQLKIDDRIKDNAGDYLELKALIGKAMADPDLKLSRSSKSALPNLKFLGDMAAHSRRNLIRPGDLNNVRNDARAAIEELASHSPLAKSD